MPEITVSFYFARPLSRLLRARGFDPTVVLAPFGLVDPKPERRVRFVDAAAAWSAVTQVTGDPAVGLATARELVPGDYGVLEFAARACNTLGEAFARIGRFHRLLNDRSGVTVSIEGDVARVHYDVLEGMPPAYVEYVLGAWVSIANQLVGAPIPLRRAQFPHAATDLRAHREMFGEVEFEAPAAELHLPAEALALPLPSADTRLLQVLDGHAETLMEELAQRFETTARVSTEIERALSDGPPRLETIADRLKIPPRSLRRKLEGEGTSFAAVVDEVRRKLALRMVDDRNVSIGEIAFLLGFSEPSAFHRAFRRWTGRTPRAS